jgi:hypothetical protein
MKSILFIFIAFISMGVFANDSSEFFHKQMNIVLEVAMDKETNIKQMNETLLKEYYPHDMLDQAFNNKSVDENGFTIAKKMNLVGDKLKTKFGPSTDDFISDYLFYEIGCLNGGSC